MKEKPKPNNDPKSYLDYIDKEITFCGIITTFSLACVLFIMDKLFTNNKSESQTVYIDFTSIYFIIVLLCLVISAYLLFKQRSNLAHHYGQICLEIYKIGFTGKDINSWLNEIDNWNFWRLYFYGVSLLGCAFSQIAVIFCINFYKDDSIIKVFVQDRLIYYFLSFLIVALWLISTFIYVKWHKRKDAGKKPPHFKVYTRVAISKIQGAGIGIIAIADIPKNEYIFYPDNDELVWVSENEIKELPENIKKLYIDFCIKKNDLYGCPINFNKLSPAWYLNNSDNPNVYSDEDYRFRALRDIEKGEELTSNYSSYSE